MTDQKRYGSLECGVCASFTKIEAVCHHCGKPLCDECRRDVEDWVFGELVIAVHCNDCQRKYHAVFPWQRGFQRD